MEPDAFLSEIQMPFSLCKSREGENISQKPVHACWNPQKPPRVDCASCWGVQKWGRKNVEQMCRREKGNEKVEIQTCVCVNWGHCYRIGERTSSTGLQLGFFLASCWYQWELHQGGGGGGGIDVFRRMCVKVKCNDAWNELKFWLTLISETAVNARWCFYLCFQLNQTMAVRFYTVQDGALHHQMKL